MKTKLNIAAALMLTGGLLVSGSLFAGNEDRSGQSGASQLLINPWARSSGWGAANVAGCRGLESMYMNVAGTAFTPKTELIFARTQWIPGADININSFGFTQRVGSTGALGMGIMAFDFGDIPITTVDKPEGGLGNFSPQMMNLGISYAKGFSDNIYGGFVFKVVSEGLSNISARGIALDAGIQYVTGPLDNIKFGVALKNIGPRMKYKGDGLTFRTPIPGGVDPKTDPKLTVEQRSDEFELPSLLNMGITYDLYVSKDSAAIKNHRVSIAGTFTSNSFSRDEFKFGAEYGFRNIVMLRAGYVYERGSEDGSRTWFTGPSAGATVEIPFGKSKKSSFGLDYSYRVTDPFGGINTFGARINL